MPEMLPFPGPVGVYVCVSPVTIITHIATGAATLCHSIAARFALTSERCALLQLCNAILSSNAGRLQSVQWGVQLSGGVDKRVGRQQPPAT